MYGWMVSYPFRIVIYCKFFCPLLESLWQNKLCFNIFSFNFEVKFCTLRPADDVVEGEVCGSTPYLSHTQRFAFFAFK